jgi:hypothetical protein
MGRSPESCSCGKDSFPEIGIQRKSRFLPRARYALGKRLPSAVLLHLGGFLCSHSSPSPWISTVPSAGICTGRCKTSWRSPTAPASAGPACAPSLPLQGRPGARCPAIWRKLAEAGVIARQRRPGGVYAYTIASRFLPAARGVSHSREKGVPPPGREEQAGKKTGYTRARFAKSGVSFGEMPDERSKWESRLRGWRTKRFWLPLWGAKPGEAGCLAPTEVLQGIQRSG